MNKVYCTLIIIIISVVKAGCSTNMDELANEFKFGFYKHYEDYDAYMDRDYL